MQGDPTIYMVATGITSGKCKSGMDPDAKKGLFHVKQTLSLNGER